MLFFRELVSETGSMGQELLNSVSFLSTAIQCLCMVGCPNTFKKVVVSTTNTV